MTVIKEMEPVGYCFGVKNSIASVMQTQKKHPGQKIFFLRPLVHNASTNLEVEKKLNSSIYDPSLPIEQYRDSYIALPAHGYTKKDLTLIKSLNADYIDCTCPILIVNKNTMANNIRSGFTVFLLGKKGHPEVLSILDSLPSVHFIGVDEIKTYDYSVFENYPKLAIYPQSTIGYEEYQTFLKKVEPHLKGKFIKGDICRECLKRWESLKRLSLPNRTTLVIVGDKDSSNANEFLNVAKENFVDCLSLLAERPEEITPFIEKIDFTRDVYIFSSTSASPKAVHSIYKYLKKANIKFILSHPFKYISGRKQKTKNKN